jgi:biopolymer transport protein ExbD
VFFKIDDEAPYGEVVQLMDIVKGAGATTLGIVTEN